MSDEVTKDDIDTMRIMFNADIEKLWNQGRGIEAVELQRIRDRLITALKEQSIKRRHSVDKFVNPWNDYISRLDARNVICAEVPLSTYMKRTVDAANKSCGVLCEKLSALPAADVEPVRHGKWEQVDEQPYFRKHFHRMCCSVCRHEGYKSYPYCPHCGTKMDGGK